MKRLAAILRALVGITVASLSAGAAHASEDTAPPPPPPPPAPIELTPEPTPASEWGVDGPYVFDLHVRIGGGGRLDAPPAYEIDDVGGLLLGVGMGLALSPRIALGLTYEHLDLGSERSQVLSGGVLNIVRELHTGWLDLKLYPFRTDTLGLYVSVAAGVSVQGADMTASLWLPEAPGTSVSFFCGATDDPGFAFQGALGFDVVVGPGVRFVLESGVANHRLSDEIIDGCVPGAGTTAVFAARGGVGYAWDL